MRTARIFVIGLFCILNGYQIFAQETDTSMHKLTIIKGYFTDDGIVDPIAVSVEKYFKSNEKVRITAFPAEVYGYCNGGCERSSGCFCNWNTNNDKNLDYIDSMFSYQAVITIPDGISGVQELNYEAYYCPNSDPYFVRVINGITYNGTDQSYHFPACHPMIIYANAAPEGYVFSHWTFFDYYTGDSTNHNHFETSSIINDTLEFFLLRRELIAYANYSKLTTNHIDANIAYQLYPNPSHSVLNLISEDEIDAVSCYHSVNGECFNQKNIRSKQYSIDISLWPAGVYLIRLEMENDIFYRKVIVE